VSIRRTKIVATLGPATGTVERITELIQAGMDVARMNFSHGSYDEHAHRIEQVRAAAARAGRAVAILQDLQGPKIRTGPLTGGGPIELSAGDVFTLTTRDVPGDLSEVSTSYAALPIDVHPGDRILLSDGAIELRVNETNATDVRSEVVYGGVLKERQGINLPGVSVSARGVTDKDIRDLEFGLSQGVDYVAISFVRTPDDVRQVKQLIEAAGHDTPVIAKLEKPEAIESLAEIIELADGVMVARGDLGVELAPERVPLVQKRIIELANLAAKPVITATQMLESMIHTPRPTRAEASDVANAILDGTDAIMLSGETAMGRYPIESVDTMVRIAIEIRQNAPHREYAGAKRPEGAPHSRAEAIGAAVEAVVEVLSEVRAVWVFTQTGTTARMIVHHRPPVPIIAFTPNESCYRRMALIWGVTPILTPIVSSFRELSDRVFPLAQQLGVAKPGETVVMTGAHPFDAMAETNFLKVHTVGT